MSAAIETEKLTKTCGGSRGIRHVDLEEGEGRAWVFGMDWANFGGATSIRRLQASAKKSGT
jgi:hypothetical protein